MTAQHEAAMAAIRRGWPCFPCKVKDKVPATPNGFKDATLDESQVGKWWKDRPGYNPAIPTGAASGVIVLDVDGPTGVESLMRLQVDYGVLPQTIAATTGRPDSRHIYFKDTGGVRNSAGKLGDGLDVRGDGGYVILPGAIHPNGNTYRWVKGCSPDEVQLAECPPWLLALIQEQDTLASVAATPTEGRITEGTRNATLFSLAGSMQRRGMSHEAILSALLAENGVKCDPPLPSEEVERIAGSIGRYEPSTNGHKASDATSPAQFPRTDAGNAELFAHLYGGSVRYDHQRGRWLLWAGHCWRPDADAEITRMVKDAARYRYASAEAIADRGERQAEAKWAIQSESRSRLDAALALSQAERPIADAGDSWDADPSLLGVTNGVVDLRTGMLRDGKQDDKITMRVPMAYDPNTKAPRWLRFLEEVFDGDAEMVDYLHRAIGYSLTGDIREQCLWVLHGRGSNGKSVFLTVLRALAGEYAHNAPFSTFEMLSRATIPNDLAALAGRRVVTASETSERTRLNEGRLKGLTGGDPQTARFLNQELFTFMPTCKIWLAVNHRPRVDDDSLGFWRRVRLIPFEKTFQGKAADSQLVNALLIELPGILAWALQGCAAWCQRGLEPPQRVQAATDDYRAASDPLTAFIRERAIVTPEVSALSGDLFKAYKEWADGEGIPVKERLGHKSFGDRLGERFVGKHTHKGKLYYGLGLTTGASE